jgi:hypothetical protein
MHAPDKFLMKGIESQLQINTFTYFGEAIHCVERNLFKAFRVHTRKPSKATKKKTLYKHSLGSHHVKNHLRKS